MHELALPLLIGLIVVALAFDFLNGLHDAANSIATVVATKLLGPVQAVAFAAFFNFAAYFLTLAWPQLHAVANTVGKGLIDKDQVTPAVVFAALVGAMFWNVVTWLKGIPSSSSHALVGGIVGAGLAAAGLGTIQWSGVSKTLLFIPLAPLLGMLANQLQIDLAVAPVEMLVGAILVGAGEEILARLLGLLLRQADVVDLGLVHRLLHIFPGLGRHAGRVYL